jgi:osmotically-inducible protein OsmY
MRTFLTLMLGLALGVGAAWFYVTYHNDPRWQAAGEKVEGAAKSARDTAQDKIHDLHLRPDDIKEELARTGQVIRREAVQAGHVLADATADARTTAAIKAKLLSSRDLSALNISVNTTGGVVTLSGTVSSADNIGRAILLAMETTGVREVVSTLQVKPKTGP